MEYRFPHDFNTVDICNRCCNSREEIDKRPNYERLCDVPNWEQLKKFGKKGKNNFEMESNGEEVLEDNDIESDGDVTIDEVTNTFTEKVGKENDKLITYFVFPVVFIVLFGVIAATIWNSELNLTRDSFIEKETNFVHSDFADSVTTESLRTVPNKSEFIATTVANNWKLNVFETYVDLEFRCGNTGHDFTRCMLWSNHDLEKYGANFKESSCSTRIFGCISLKEFHEAWSECKSEYSARFNVLIGVHPRKSDPNFMYLKRALQSIRSQTYPYWRVFIAGDGLESDHVQKLLTHLDSELSAFNLNWFFVNVPPVCSERNLQGIESTVVWAIGGVASINAAMALPFYLNDQYSARLDDDDYFLETHLEDLAAGFALFNVDFAYTQGDGFVGEVNPIGGPFPKNDGKLCKNKEPPGRGGLLHPTVAWKTSRTKEIDPKTELNRISYRGLNQKHTPPEQTIQAADGDLWARITIQIRRGELSSIFIPKNSVIYNEKL